MKSSVSAMLQFSLKECGMKDDFTGTRKIAKSSCRSRWASNRFSMKGAWPLFRYSFKSSIRIPLNTLLSKRCILLLCFKSIIRATAPSKRWLRQDRADPYMMSDSVCSCNLPMSDVTDSIVVMFVSPLLNHESWRWNSVISGASSRSA